jgi:hypothetical protein
MFIYTIDEEVSLKLIELKDADRVFNVTDILVTGWGRIIKAMES